jgi:hypothetical protein
MNSNPRWVQLLEQKKADGYYGLGIAFLVGALRAPVESRKCSEACARDEIESLLRKMLDEAPAHHMVRIGGCDEKMGGNPVAALVYFQARVGLFSESQKRPTITGDDVFQRGGNWTISTLTEDLVRIVGQPIAEGNFSFVNDRFRYFTRDDLSLIQRSQEI